MSLLTRGEPLTIFLQRVILRAEGAAASVCTSPDIVSTVRKKIANQRWFALWFDLSSTLGYLCISMEQLDQLLQWNHLFSTILASEQFMSFLTNTIVAVRETFLLLAL